MAAERVLRWESPQRYYAARVYEDLLGDTVVGRSWGGLHNNVGNTDTVVVMTPEGAAREIEEINARRTAHHYTLVADQEQ